MVMTVGLWSVHDSLWGAPFKPTRKKSTSAAWRSDLLGEGAEPEKQTPAWYQGLQQPLAAPKWLTAPSSPVATAGAIQKINACSW